MQTAESLERKITIRNEILTAFERIYNRPLPAFLTSRQAETLGIETVATLNKSAVHRIGLLPVSTGSRGRPRRYPVSACIDYLLEKQETRAARAAKKAELAPEPLATAKDGLQTARAAKALKRQQAVSVT